MTAFAVPLDLRAFTRFADVNAEIRRLSRIGAPVALVGLDRLESDEASLLLDFFLHDPASTVPLEPFAALLAAFVRRCETSLWALQQPETPPDAFLPALPEMHPECLACACFSVCQGYAAWAESCATWRPLLQELARAARELVILRQLG